MLLQRLKSLPGVAIALFAGSAWALAADRVASRLGAHEAAPALGMLAGVVIALALWRRDAADTLEASLLRMRCPSCGGALTSAHDHAGERHPGGLREWNCAACGFAHAVPLTCVDCAP
jgi:hypothetical protein